MTIDIIISESIICICFRLNSKNLKIDINVKELITVYLIIYISIPKYIVNIHYCLLLFTSNNFNCWFCITRSIETYTWEDLITNTLETIRTLFTVLTIYKIYKKCDYTIKHSFHEFHRKQM